MAKRSPQVNWEYRKWNVQEFRGKFHKNRLHAAYPVSGSQIVAERERDSNERNRKQSLSNAIAQIKSREADTIKYRCRHERASGNAKIFGQLNDALGRVRDVVKDLGQIDTFGDEPFGEDARDKSGLSYEQTRFLDYVSSLDVFHLAKMLKSGFREPDTRFEETGDTALHIAVKNGDIAMVKLLLHFQANPNLYNLHGDAPIHLAWRFWRHQANSGRLSLEEKVRQECAEDDAKTYELLLALLQGRADPSICRSEGSTALHEAARRGPIKAIVVLLQVRVT